MCGEEMCTYMVELRRMKEIGVEMHSYLAIEKINSANVP